jgi:hypothetical protein
MSEKQKQQEQPQQQEGQTQQQQSSSPLKLESTELAEQHRKERGEDAPMSPGRTGLGRHYNIGGGRADFGPVDVERMAQKDERDIPARLP